MSKVSLERVNQAHHFKIENETGNVIHTDGSPDIGGDGKGMRPMELLLAAAASCSSIDVVLILKKMKQDLIDLKVEVEAEKEKMDTYSRWNVIHLHYKLYGDIKPKKAEQAVKMSIEKYCSVTKTLEKNSEIKYTVEVIAD